MDDVSYERLKSAGLVRAEMLGLRPVADMLMAPINCDGCTACCCVDWVELHPEDESSQYQTTLVDGKSVLQHAEDGRCIYLKEGCTIYDHRPLECRTFNCTTAVRLGIPVDRTIVEAALKRIPHALPICEPVQEKPFTFRRRAGGDRV